MMSYYNDRIGASTHLLSGLLILFVITAQKPVFSANYSNSDRIINESFEILRAAGSLTVHSRVYLHFQ